jgi:hypothetical protein
VYDDLGLVMPLCHLDGSPTEDRDATNTFLREHVVEDRSADKASRACENKMHCDALLMTCCSGEGVEVVVALAVSSMKLLCHGISRE